MKKYPKVLAILGASTLAAISLAACSSSGSSSSGSGDQVISANGCEPQNPLIPSNTTETCGGRVIDLINSGLVYFDADGKMHNDLAASIDHDGALYTVKLRDGIEFSDGTPITSESFVKAWNFTVAHALTNESFFEPIQGYQEVADKTAEEMSGLKVVDDKTFTIELTQPEADFPLRLGYSAFYPLPDSAYDGSDDLAAYGNNPISSGPYKLDSWDHNTGMTLVPNDKYTGDQKAKNNGIKFVFYSKQDAAYADLQAGNLDVLDQVPDSAFTTYMNDLDGRGVNQASAVFQSFTIPEKLEHFGNDQEGKLRRQAISMAVDRKSIVEKIFNNTRTPATDFTSPVVDGHSDSLNGEDVLEYNPDRAKELWAQADAISPWSGTFTLAYNADGGHQAWVDAAVNSIKNTLGIDAVGKPYPDFKSFRTDVRNRTIGSAFRTGWQADYPGLGNFLEPLYSTGASSNDGDYSNPQFDALLKQAAGANSVDESNRYYNEAQEILLQDLPAIPLWYSNVNGGWSDRVSNVKFNWKSVPVYTDITVK
ncbi:MAG: ABC transporter substrate-binding protein [Corynebacterium sp.]|nr:ABC transporter substrate-binding protein [Corynebacterium sp.]